jgi:hypothetical protein
MMDAQLRSKPSYAWRSIQGAIDLLESGLIWRIGDGENAGIWGDKWIPILNAFMIQTQPRLMHATTRVRELIDSDVQRLDI